MPETWVYLSELNEIGKRLFDPEWLLPVGNRELIQDKERYYSWMNNPIPEY